MTIWHDDYTNSEVEPYWEIVIPKLCTRCSAPWLRMGSVMFCRYCENVLVVEEADEPE